MDTAPCKCFTDRAVRASLERWGLYDEIKAVRVRYDRKGKDEELIKGILSDEVRTALGLPLADDDAAVRVERLKCEATTLAIFDPVAASQDVILGSGRAKQCPQVVIGGVECDNALRTWLARKKYDREVAAGARDAGRGDHRGGHVPQVIPGGLFRGSRAEFRGPVRRASRGSIRSGLGIPRRGGFVRGRARSIVPARRGGSRPPEPPPARSGRESRGRSGRENRRHPPHPRRRVWKLPEPRFQRRRGGSRGVESTTGDAPRRFEKRDFRAVSVSARHA